MQLLRLYLAPFLRYCIYNYLFITQNYLEHELRDDTVVVYRRLLLSLQTVLISLKQLSHTWCRSWSSSQAGHLAMFLIGLRCFSALRMRFLPLVVRCFGTPQRNPFDTTSLRASHRPLRPLNCPDSVGNGARRSSVSLVFGSARAMPRFVIYKGDPNCAM